MKKILSLVGLFIVACLSHISAQSKIAVAPLYPLTKSSKGLFFSSKEVASPAYLTSFSVDESKSSSGVKAPLAPNDYYQQYFGFFCKKEWKLEKQTAVPVKVRLGTYQEAQRLEGK